MESVSAVFRFSENGKVGYVAIVDDGIYSRCSTLSELLKEINEKGITSQLAYKYYTNELDVNFDNVNIRGISKYFKVKICRSFSKFASFVKSYLPSLLIKPTNINGVIFDMGYIHIGSFIYKWNSLFEEVPSRKNFDIDSTGTIIKYTYSQPIYILLSDLKRHIPKFNEEILLINLRTGEISHSLSAARGSVYGEYSFSMLNGRQVCTFSNEVPIAGYKLRS